MKIVDYGAHRITAEVEAATEGLLVLSEVFYPGWRVEVNGEPRPLLATNLALRGVYLEAGNHTVVYTYRPTVFFVGAAISIATVAAIIVAWILWPRPARLRVSSSKK